MPRAPVSDVSAGPDAAGWSPERMLSRLGGDRALARQLAAIFISEHATLLSALRDSIESGSADAVRLAAHAIKGSILNFVEGGPAVRAYELETIGRDNRLADASRAFERLERDVAVLVRQLQEFEAGDRCGF